jgi:uncharacterized cupredoxin-like copper-binding protein
MGVSLIGFGAVGAQDGRRTVEVTIKDYAFKVQAKTLQLHEPVRIVLHNTDEVQHGFTSEALDGMDVRVESNGVVTYGRGIKGLYVDPGAKVELLFTPDKSGALNFRCDLHPRMKGELVVLTIGAA